MNNWFTEKEIKIAVSNKKMLLTGNKKKKIQMKTTLRSKFHLSKWQEDGQTLII